MSRFAECLDIAVKHGQELYRIQFLAVKRHFHVKVVSTDGYRLTCFYLLSETDEYISKMRVGHFVFAVAYDNIYTMLFVRTDTWHDTAGHCRQRAVTGMEVYTVMKGCLSSDGIFQFSVAFWQCYFFILFFLKGHTIAAWGL